MWNSFTERVVNLNNQKEVAEIRDFLAPFELSFDGQVDYTVAIMDNDTLIATGSLSGPVLRNFAVDENYQGENLTGKVVTHLLSEAARRGHFHTFLFTKPKIVQLFTQLGFALLCEVEKAALLETGLPSIANYKQDLAAQTADLPPGRRAVLVMNCNPFTKGHQAIIEQAARECDSVVVLVVSEDQSAFPFAVRYELVKAGVKHLANVRVVPSGPYTVSRATFPDYFVKGNDVVTAQTQLDAKLFAVHIAPTLQATVRYVGEEPYCEVTRAYNSALAAVLPQHGIEVKVVRRLAQDDEAISASKVRELIRQGKIAEIAAIVPETTYEYLQSAQAKVIIEKIRTFSTRH
ncbi:MAG: [citrate (pro-3S)-lyase] ligase [Sporomusaceae bacterium]|nr:[citrate (pro-3S)-lyase] ligase [Sporomusaceae bacterium]